MLIPGTLKPAPLNLKGPTFNFALVTAAAAPRAKTLEDAVRDTSIEWSLDTPLDLERFEAGLVARFRRSDGVGGADPPGDINGFDPRSHNGARFWRLILTTVDTTDDGGR